jgi:hypothetical protein
LPFQIDLSHNKIPFVTKKMFPEHKWIPYKLEKLDLSHNLMPVLTKEILRGTKHLKYLNVSYNMLNDVRKGVLGNLTSLEVLDISGNVLQDKYLNEDRRFGLLPNLTVFKLARNKFTEIPVHILAESKKLEVLDISYNSIKYYYPELTERIKEKLEIFYEGNPLHCNCFLRPIAYWLLSVGRVQNRGHGWDMAKCEEPKYLNGIPVGSLIEEQLICEDSEEAQMFKLNPDVKFRQLNE